MKRQKSFDPAIGQNIREVFMFTMLFWPMMAISFVNVKLLLLLYILSFICLFPIINLINSFYKVSILQYNDLYPTTHYILQQRSIVHSLSQIIMLYPDNIIFDIKPLILKSQGDTLVVSISESSIDKLLFHYIGIYELKPAIFNKYYNIAHSADMHNMQYYLENNKFISIYWYRAIYSYILNNWWYCYSWKFLYQHALSGKSDVALEADLLESFNKYIIESTKILEDSFKLLWNIEKDWELGSIINDKSSQQLIDYKLSYHSFNIRQPLSLDNITVVLQCYRNLIAVGAELRTFNEGLEDMIKNHLFVNYTYIEFIKRFFEECGWILVKDASIITDDAGERITLKQTYLQTTLKKQAYIMVMQSHNQPINEIQHLINNYLSKAVDEDLKKWRHEWENNV